MKQSIYVAIKKVFQPRNKLTGTDFQHRYQKYRIDKEQSPVDDTGRCFCPRTKEWNWTLCSYQQISIQTELEDMRGYGIRQETMKLEEKLMALAWLLIM